MKKIYQTPELLIVRVAPHAHLLLASVQDVYSDTSVGLRLGGASSSSDSGGADARVKDYNVWDDDWSNYSVPLRPSLYGD